MKGKKQTKKELVEFGKKISEKGLVVGPGGNISARCGKIVCIKASGIAFEEAKERHYIEIDLKSGIIPKGGLKPSCELPFHLGCYRAREDINAVIHTHPPLATGLACAGVVPKPMYPDFVAIVGRELPLLKYVCPAGEEIAREVVKKIRKHNAILLMNHGLITVGSNLREAYYRNLIVEEMCRAFVVSRAVGKPRFLTSAEITEIENMGAERYRQALLKKRRV